MVCIKGTMTQIKSPKLVAEIGCNHQGKVEVAVSMLKTISNFCNVVYVKFQKRNPLITLSKQEFNSPHPVPKNSYGDTYGEHREVLEFDIETHRVLKAVCDDLGLVYSCSTWDVQSAYDVSKLNPQFIKIPSACSTYWDMHRTLFDEFGGDIHVSTGMTTKKEIEKIVDLYVSKGRNQNLVLYHCTSGYPIDVEDACLLEIPRLKKIFGNDVKAIGFSGHHLGISLDIAAYALGAEWIERHVTLNRVWKGTDHAASLEPDYLRRLKRDLDNAHSAFRVKDADLLEVELSQAKKLRWDRHSNPMWGDVQSEAVSLMSYDLSVKK